MILFVLILAGAAGFAAGFVFGRSSAMPVERRQRAQLRVAQKGLRQIANSLSGSPELDAQLALEEIDKKDV